MWDLLVDKTSKKIKNGRPVLGPTIFVLMAATIHSPSHFVKKRKIRKKMHCPCTVLREVIFV
jgi:hypothetical protein